MDVVCRTDRGLVREHNEDSLLAFPEEGLMLVADGMGGHNAGEVASRLAVETVAAEVLPDLRGTVRAIGKERLRRAVMAANRALFRAVETEPELAGMGTTIVAVLVRDHWLHFAHVGDSRLYRFRGGRLVQMTQDHSMLQELLNQGMFASVEEATEAGVPTSVLTRGLGIEEGMEVDVGALPTKDGDLYLLCTDGLSGLISEEALASAMTSAADTGLERTADLLVEAALAEGGSDNISLILLQIPGG